MERLERLVNLVAALLDAERPLTREDIRQRVGGYSGDPAAFRRNFERDKDVLRQMGLPLVTETLDGAQSEDQAGYRIPRDLYELGDPGLSEAELTALRIAAAAVRMEGPWGSEATTSALRKLAAAGGGSAHTAGGSAANTARGGEAIAAGGGSTNPAAAKTAERNTGMQVADLAGGDAVVVTFAAIAERRQLDLTYRGERRRIDPWHLSYRQGKWYLAGYDHKRESERLYRLDRVEGAVEAVGEPGCFEPPARSSSSSALPAWRLGEGPDEQAVIHVDAVQAPWAVASVGEEGVRARHDDGSVEVELTVNYRPALFSWVIGFLDHAEIVGPPEVRAAFVSYLEEVESR